MTLILNKGELTRVYKFACNLHNPEATKVFNGIFGDTPAKHVITRYHQDTGLTEVNLDQEIANEFLDILVKNGYSIGQLKQSSGLGLITKIKTLAMNAKADFQRLASKF